ncbi:MAG: Abi family protein [Arcobacter sp.]|jgi:abortive infection bacteriophage resistance protein|uniref:Abi family protein n=1 Tax=Arcobacter sp. TaxID=1872629 RepID=UPI002A76120B|nr:Abi family protein [Arcobacter sp.]MDY3204968.1 Abi family protein [Arcobacter sp.]
MTNLQEQLRNIQNQNNSYKKSFKTFDEQLVILKERKLHISNDSFVLSKLQRINYYRLSAYFLPFQYSKNSEKKDIFLEDTTFEDILQLYYFDCELRKIVFVAIESIEIYFRTQITYYHALKYGAFGYLKKENFETSQEFFDKIKSNLKEETKRSEESFIKHFKDEYNTDELPLWAVVEVVSFGTISKLYSILKTQEQEAIILKLKGINKKVFKNWLHGLSVIRNICAHHSRLWNKTLGVKFEIPRKMKEFTSIKKIEKNVEIKLNDKLFFVLNVIEYILNSIGEDEINFKSEIKDLFHKYPNVKIESMGFIEDWEQNSIWKN